MKPAVALVFGSLLGAIIVACSSAPRPTKVVTMPPVGPSHGDPHDQITQYDQAIDDGAAKMQLARPAPSIEPRVTAMSVQNPTSQEDPSCKVGATDTCKSSCELADAICINADKICKIAGQLRDDAWANDKCAGGASTCKAAHDKCCGCV